MCLYITNLWPLSKMSMIFEISVKNWYMFMYHIADAIFNAGQCNH